MNRKSIRDKIVKRIMDLQNEHFIPMHRDTHENISKRDDHELNLYLKAHEQMHIEWAVGIKKNDHDR